MLSVELIFGEICSRVIGGARMFPSKFEILNSNTQRCLPLISSSSGVSNPTEHSAPIRQIHFAQTTSTGYNFHEMLLTDGFKAGENVLTMGCGATQIQEPLHVDYFQARHCIWSFFVLDWLRESASVQWVQPRREGVRQCRSEMQWGKIVSHNIS